MPLYKSMSHSDIVKELMHDYNKTGNIGNTKPKDKKHAMEIANAIAYSLHKSYKKESYTSEYLINKMEEALNKMEKV